MFNFLKGLDTFQLLISLYLVFSLVKQFFSNFPILIFVLWLLPLIIITYISLRHPTKKFFQSIGFIFLIYFMFDSVTVFGVQNVNIVEIIEVTFLITLFINSVLVAANMRQKR